MLIFKMVGARGFEPPTPSPPDWCANRAALRPDTNSNRLCKRPVTYINTVSLSLHPGSALRPDTNSNRHAIRLITYINPPKAIY
jgi:hypothetical protein